MVMPLAPSRPPMPAIRSAGLGAAPSASAAPTVSHLRAPDPSVRGLNSAEAAASNRTARRLEAERDRLLVERAQNGDLDAFRRLVDRHQRRAFAVALSLVRDENDAREVVQEAFLRVHRSLDSFNGGSSFFTWLYRIVTNASIDLMRKPSRREAELDSSLLQETDGGEIPLLARLEGADPMEVVRRREIAARIQAALDELPPYHRGVIVMREIQGMSYEEMAEAMNVSKGTIMSRLFHARQKLQRALSDCYEEQIGRRPGQGGLGEDP